MKTNWTLADYRDLYNERAGIMEHDGGCIPNIANAKAFIEVLELFIANENPSDEEIAEFKKKMSKRDR